MFFRNEILLILESVKSIATFSFFILFTLSGFGWSDMGHRFTGIIAHQNLPDSVQKKVLKILSHHPEYDAHFVERMPENVSSADENIRSIWLFSQMACWPDVIKDRALNYSPQHRKWHYVNYPIYLTELDKRYYANNIPVNLETKPTGDNPDLWNIQQAFQYNFELVRHGKPSEQAIALCWLFHLIGDIHQPLHSSALFSERKFESGDAGGNAISVKGIGVLHVAWDRSTYNKLTDGFEFVDYVNFCDSSSLFKLSTAYYSTNFFEWVKESNELAMEVGYPKELLKEIEEADVEQYGFGNPLEVKLDKGFTQHWKNQIYETAHKRMAQSGRRIAAVLSELLAD